MTKKEFIKLDNEYKVRVIKMILKSQIKLEE